MCVKEANISVRIVKTAEHRFPNFAQATGKQSATALTDFAYCVCRYRHLHACRASIMSQALKADETPRDGCDALDCPESVDDSAQQIQHVPSGSMHLGMALSFLLRRLPFAPRHQVPSASHRAQNDDECESRNTENEDARLGETNARKHEIASVQPCSGDDCLNAVQDDQKYSQSSETDQREHLADKCSEVEDFAGHSVRTDEVPDGNATEMENHDVLPRRTEDVEASDDTAVSDVLNDNSDFSPPSSHETDVKEAIEVLPDPVSFTARMCAAARAVEAKLPAEHRLFHDPLAAHFAGPVALRRRERVMHKDNPRFLSPRIAIRTKYFDDFLLQSLQICNDSEEYPRQVVILGAGMDTRPYRLAELSAISSNIHSGKPIVVYEVDQQCVVDLKNTLLEQLNPPAKPHCVIHRVASDVTQLGWESALVMAGFDWRQPSVWILEGLIYYFKSDVVDSIFRTVSYLTCQGSRICFSNVSEKTKNEHDENSHEPSSRQAPKQKADTFSKWPEFQFVCPDPAKLLRRTGFCLESIVHLGGEGAHFGRWPDDKEPSKSTMYVTCRPSRGA